MSKQQPETSADPAPAMDRFSASRQIIHSARVSKDIFIPEKCRGKSVLDIGCIRHSAEFAANDPHWLHRKISTAASRILGVDYLPGEVEKLRAQGYNIVYGDAAKPLAIDEKFDVIFAGDIIEHLANFEAFFANCDRLLKTGGQLILTTGNPLYIEGIHYAALKKGILINPEHTCWMCPQAMAQLLDRFSFQIKESHFVENKWKLKNFICESSADPYDIVHDRWALNSKARRIARRLAGILFEALYIPLKALSFGFSPLVAYSDYIVVAEKKPL